MTAVAAGAQMMRWCATGGELLLVVWSIPFVVLLVGLPFVGAVWLLLQLVTKLFGS